MSIFDFVNPYRCSLLYDCTDCSEPLYKQVASPLIQWTLHYYFYVSKRGWVGGIIMDESSHGKVNMFSTTRIRTCILADTS